MGWRFSVPWTGEPGLGREQRPGGNRWTPWMRRVEVEPPAWEILVGFIPHLWEREDVYRIHMVDILCLKINFYTLLLHLKKKLK